MIINHSLNIQSNKILSTLAISLFCIIGITLIQLAQVRNIEEIDNNQGSYKKQEEIASFNLDFLNKTPSFGFGNLVSDWIMLRFIQYFGDGEARRVTGYSLSSNYLEAIINHDPRFISAYIIISPASSLYAGTPNRTVELMEQGLKELSPEIQDSYFVWLYKAVDELLFLGDVDAAKQSYEMAAKWAELSDDAQSDKIAKSASKTAQFLSEKRDSKKAQVNAWGLVLSNTSDEATRDLAIRRIEELGGEVEITSEMTPQGKVTQVRVIPPKED